jgi:nucleotide-binding universal stress UspA family protein
VTILFAFDGSESSAAAFAAAGRIFGQVRPDAVVLTVWEPLSVEAIRATRFGGWWIPLPLDVTEADETSEMQAEQLAAHGARLAAEAGFAARAIWRADSREIAATIFEEANALDADLIVIGGHGLTGIRASLGGVSSHILRHATRPVLVAPRRKVDAAHEHEDDVAAVG